MAEGSSSQEAETGKSSLRQRLASVMERWSDFSHQKRTEELAELRGKLAESDFASRAVTRLTIRFLESGITNRALTDRFTSFLHKRLQPKSESPKSS